MRAASVTSDSSCLRMTGSAVSAVAACAVAEKGEHACRRGGRGRGSGRGESSLIAPPTSRPFKACRAMSDLRLLSRWSRGRTCRKKTDDKWHVAVASAHVGRATASGTARCRRCRGRHVGRGGRVGPCRTCDGVGAGPAVGGGEPTRRTWRSRRPRSDVRRRRRRLRGRRCRANRWDVASASAHVGRATAAEAGQPSDVAAPRVGPRLLLHVRQKSMWRIDRGAREN